MKTCMHKIEIMPCAPCASCFSCTFLAVVARLQRESAKFHVLSRTGKKDNNLLFRFLNFEV